MPLYPDLASNGILFMHFAVHVGDGLVKVDDFWKKRGVGESAKRVLFATYSRQGKQHTVWLKWARSHDDCCDVVIGFDAWPPSKSWPRLKAANHRLKEGVFREFLESLAKLPGLGRVQAKYGFPWIGGLESVVPLLPSARPVSLTFEVVDDHDKVAMLVTYEKLADTWVTIAAPRRRFMIKDEPVRDSFFHAPFELALALAKAVQRTEGT